MKLFYAEANIDGLVKLSPGTIELKHPPRQECIVYLIARRAINLFVYLKGLLGYDFFLDFSDYYFKSIYEDPTHISIFTAGKCSSAIANDRDFLYEKSHCKVIIGKRAT